MHKHVLLLVIQIVKQDTVHYVRKVCSDMFCFNYNALAKICYKIHAISRILYYFMQNGYLYISTTKIHVTVAVYSLGNHNIRFGHQWKVKCSSSSSVSQTNMPISEMNGHVGYQSIYQYTIFNIYT